MYEGNNKKVTSLRAYLIRFYHDFGLLLFYFIPVMKHFFLSKIILSHLCTEVKVVHNRNKNLILNNLKS